MQLEGRVSTGGQKTFTLFKNGMFNYMAIVRLNDAESFLVAYLNYEIVQKSVEGRLSQQMVRNDSLFMTLFDCFGPLLSYFEKIAHMSVV